MAIDAGSTNTTRYYTVPNSTDFDIGTEDWTWITPITPQITTNPGYFLSNGAYKGTNTLNLFSYPSSVGFAMAVLSNEIAWTGGVPTNGTEYVFYAARRSGSYVVGAVPLGGTTANEGTLVLAAQTITTSNDIHIARRFDGSAARYWRGTVGMPTLVSGYGITEAEAVEIAQGAPLLTMPFAPSIVELFHFQNADNATTAGIIKGHVATRVGTSWGSDEEDIIIPYTGSISIPFSGAVAGVGNPYYIYEQMRRH